MDKERIALLDMGRDSKLYHLDRLRQVPEASLNRHLIIAHLTQPAALNRVGFQYDAEMATFLGYSLQETADVVVELLERIAKGEFGDTDTYKKIKRSYTTDYFGLPSIRPDPVLAQLNRLFHYEGRLHAELGTLQSLGVAEVGLASGSPSDLRPITTDSFFRDFNIVDLDDFPALA